jgi:hypothetical protein
MKRLKICLAFVMVFLFSEAVAQIKNPPLPPPPQPPAEIKAEKAIDPRKMSDVELPIPPVPPKPDEVKFTPPVIVKDEILPFTPPKIVKNHKRNSLPVKNKFIPLPPPPKQE